MVDTTTIFNNILMFCTNPDDEIMGGGGGTKKNLVRMGRILQSLLQQMVLKKIQRQGKLYKNLYMSPKALLYVATNTYNILADYLHKK